VITEDAECLAMSARPASNALKRLNTGLLVNAENERIARRPQIAQQNNTRTRDVAS